MPPWISNIRTPKENEARLDSLNLVQLATIAIDNTPGVRTVVFRGWSNSSEMEIFTHKRSQKYHEHGFNNNVDICWLLPKSKVNLDFE